MALTGNVDIITRTPHETETETITYTYPDDSAIYGDQAGETITETIPASVVSTTSYTNTYVCIRSVNNYNTWVSENGSTTKIKEFQVDYAVYTDEATRNADKDNFLYQDVAVLHNIDMTQNLYSQAYSQIKSMEGFTNLIDG
jgi:hypothetical protein